MSFMNWICLAVWCLSILLLVCGTFQALRHFNQRRSAAGGEASFIPISILKPLRGVDDGLAENLESFFQLDYEDYELIFSVADAEDPARSVVEELLNKYPDRAGRLLVGETAIGINPKVNNLVRGYESARHDWILISDSNVRAEPDYLKRMSAVVSKDTGVVTAVVRGDHPLGLGGRLEAVYLSSFFARWMKMASAFGHPCVLGKSMLFRRSVANRFGGMRTLGPYLAEDYMTGVAMDKLGLAVLLMHQPVSQYLGHYSVPDFWARHLRWGRMRKSHAPMAFLLEMWLGALGSGLLGAWAWYRLVGGSPTEFLSAHLLVWLLLDLCVMKSLAAKIEWCTPCIWLLRECLAFPLWIHIWLGNVVNWRGRRFKILPGGILDSAYLPETF